METAYRKRIGLLVGGLLVLSACSAPWREAAADEPQPPPSEIAIPDPSLPQVSEPPSIRAILDQLEATARPSITCPQTATQGGAIVCTSNVADVTVLLDGKPVAVTGEEGLAVIGLTRTQTSPVQVSLRMAEGAPVPFASVEVLPRHDTISKFEMECGRIAPQSKADQKKAEDAWIKKDNALKSFNPPLAPLELTKPVEGNYSSSFGATRTYIPKTKACEPTTNVHNGSDIAVPTGTEIRAPMAGTVILADPDLFYEGGCIFLDLGYGLVSVTMHMSRIDVKAGDRVERGQLLGLSGATGRVTGPHVHWAIKFRNVLSEDRSTDIWLDPVLMLGLKSPS